MAWESIARKQRKYEMVSLFLFGACIICGFIGDCVVMQGGYFIRVVGMDGVSLVILQIQGTIDTLSIAVLSLLGGRVSETYMGIPLIDFTLNRKPLYLKQKRIIYSLISLLCVNIFLHLLGLYNAVLAVFLVTAGLIVISIKEIYEVFSGHIVIEDEIRSYLADRAVKGIHSEHLDLMHKFCDEWKLNIAIQTEPEYEVYRQIFDILFKKIFQDEAPNSRAELQNYIYPSIHALLCAEVPSSRRRGLSFLNEVYQNAWNCIYEYRSKKSAGNAKKDGVCNGRVRGIARKTESNDKNGGKAEERKTQNETLPFSDGFHLFHTVCYHLQEVVESLPIAEADQELKWFDTIEYVFLVNYWLAEEAEDRGELFDTARFAGAMGRYLAENRNQNWHADKWEKPFGFLRLPQCPPDRMKQMEFHWSETLLFYAVSLVNGNMLDLLENSLYTRGMPSLYSPVGDWKARLLLEIHCYIYYLAEYEIPACISEDLRQSCKGFLLNYKIRQNFSRFLYQISGSREILNPNLEKQLCDRLARFEFFPRGAMSKQMVMETAVHNFVVFTVLHLYGEYDSNHMMEYVLSDEFVKYYLTEYVKLPREIINRLDVFLQMLSATEEVEKDPAQRKARARYALLERMTKQRLKTILMKEASGYPREDERASLEELARQIEGYVNEEFALIRSEEAKSAPEHKICCFDLNTVADMRIEDYLPNYYGEIADGMLWGLCKYLIKTGSLLKINRKDFQDDADYIAHIKNSDAEIVLGSRQMFLAERYGDQKILDRYLEERKTAFIGYRGIGMLLKENSLRIHIEKVNISVRPVRIWESGARYDSENDEYIYNTSGTELIYKREELADYLRQSRKMIHVAVRLSIKTPKGAIGDALCADRFMF